MRPPALAKAALVALLVTLPAGARADFADAVRAYEAGDYATAYAEWLPLAERGDPAAERNIGHLYRMGWSVPQDFEEAAKWYRRAAEKGFARAQANLANMYLRGQGLERDHAMALEWFRRAGLQGHAVAQYNLGLMYESGLGVEQSDAKAMGWYHLASRTGHRRASDKLALLIAKSTSELGTLIEVPTMEPADPAEEESAEGATALAAAEEEPVVSAALEPETPAEEAAREPIAPVETAGSPPTEPVETDESVEPAETAALEPADPVEAEESVVPAETTALAPAEPVDTEEAVEPAETTALAPAEPIETEEAVEPIETAAAEPAESPAPEGPRRDPVEVVLDELGPDPDAAAALEMAVIEPAAGDTDLGSQGVGSDATRALSPATSADATDDAAVPADEEEKGTLDPSPPDLSLEAAEPSAPDVSGEAADIAPMAEEEPGFFATFLDALKGQSQHPPQETIDANERGEPVEEISTAEAAADDFAGEEPAPPLEVAELDSIGAAAAVEGAESSESEREGPAATEEPLVATDALIDLDEPASEDTAPVEVAALIAVEPEPEPATEESVRSGRAEPTEPAPDRSAAADDSTEPAADRPVAADDSTEPAATDEIEEEERGLLAAFFDALKGQSKREREELADPEPAADGMAAAASSDGMEAAKPVETAALDPAPGEAEDEILAAAPAEEEDFSGLALDALRGDAQAAEAPFVADTESGADAGLANENLAAIDSGPAELPIDWDEPEAAAAVSVTAALESSESSGSEPPIDLASAEEQDAEVEADAERERPATLAVAEEGERGDAEPPIDWDEPGEAQAAAAEPRQALESGPPVEVAAAGDSSAALQVVAAALGTSADLEGMSDSERLSAGLAAYRARDYAGAVTAWLPLAERGNRTAQFYVGGLYLDGTGLPPSRVWAHVFWTLAAEQGQEAAGELLAVLTADMLPVERGEARDLTAAWSPRR